MGITLQCSSDVLDPAITNVFNPVKKIKEVVSIGVKKKTTPRNKKMKNATSRKKEEVVLSLIVYFITTFSVSNGMILPLLIIVKATI